MASDDFIIKNRLYFRKVENQPLLALTEIDKELDGQVRKSRFIITTDFQELYAKDTQTGLTLAISLMIYQPIVISSYLGMVLKRLIMIRKTLLM